MARYIKIDHHMLGQRNLINLPDSEFLVMKRVAWIYVSVSVFIESVPYV